MRTIELPEGYAPVEIPLQHYIAGGVYAKQMWLQKAGMIVYGHKHHFDHLSLLVRGSAKVTVDGVATVYHSPCGVNIVANAYHEIVSLEDDTLWYCVHQVPADLVDLGDVDALLISGES